MAHRLPSFLLRRMRRLRLRDERAFTLIEMVVVCAILGLVLTGLTSAFLSGTHSEINLTKRFQAQQSARFALDGLRIDARNACAANVPSTAKLVLALVPTSNDTTLCGSAATSSYPKAIWCALTSPTISTQYALYRSTATDSSCTSANGKLVADGLTSNGLFSISSGAPVAACAAGTICVQQLETVRVSIPVSFVQGTQQGKPYALSQTIALRNTVFQTTSATTACTVAVPCTPGTCLFNGPVCYPPAIQ
jgi:prepilin-type N-terminal cleavage/methylation domain-containing protein